MKNIVKSLIIIFVLVPFLSTANGNKDENAVDSRCTIFQDNKNGTINLVYRPQSHKVKIFLYNDHNELIFVDKVKSNKVFVRPYKFDNLNPGEYKFKIVENNQSLTQEVNYYKAKNTIAPIIHVGKKDKIYRLSVVGYSEPGVEVRIYNHVNQLIFKDKVNQEEGFIRDYNLNAVNSSGYRFVVTVNGKNYTKQIY